MWSRSLLRASALAPGRTAWAPTQLGLLDSSNGTLAAYGSLLPYVTETGKSELNFLIETETKMHESLADAPSADVYLSFQKTLPVDRLRKDALVLAAATKTCAQA